MARIIVMADRVSQGAPAVLLDESVEPVHLSTGHAAMQLIERLGWAISDAEDAERAHARRRGAPSQRSDRAQRAHAARRQLSATSRQLSTTGRQPSASRRQLSAPR
jgi:hypothetical protein